MGRQMITLEQAAAWCGGRVSEEYKNIAFFGANFDTRLLREGELFVALKGQRDGHDFAQRAIELGAAAVLASEPLPETIPAIYTDDTLRALQAIAAAWRERLSCKVIGITGSVGKTTTKEMVAAVLEKRFCTLKTAQNYNNDIGVPIMLLRITPEHEAAVLEMGMNHFGELSVLTRLARPNMALITNVGTMHIENLGSREGILRAKLEILEGLQEGGRVLFCGDNDLLSREAEKYRALTFGLSEDCTVRGGDLSVRDGQTTFTVTAGTTKFDVTLPLLGEHNVLDALAAAAVGLELGVTPTEITDAMREFRNTGHRQRRLTVGGVRIIDDCYNAGPESMRAALNVLAQEKGRRIAVLGGMLELGAYAPQAHYEVGAYAVRRAELLYAYGDNSEQYVRGAKENGLPNAEKYETHEALYAALRRELSPGDTVLLKGSRGMHMERVLDLFTEESKNGGI